MRAMTKRTRSILFIIVTVLFLTAAPLTVLYSLGWRVDWKEGRAIKVGLLYLQISPRGSEIYLNGKLSDKTNIIFNSATIGNLLPGKYLVEVKRDGYYPWQKTLEIKEKEATEAKNILLIPQDPGFSTLTKGVKDFYFSPDGKKIILKDLPGPQDDKAAGRSITEAWALKLFDTKNNIKSRLVGEKSKPLIGNNELMNLKFSSDSKTLLLEIANNEQLEYYLLDISEDPAILTPLDFLDTSLDFNNTYFNPRNPKRLLTLSGGNLLEIDFEKKEVSQQLAGNVVSFSIHNDNLYYIDSTGFVFRINLMFETKDKISKDPFPVKEETGYAINGVNSFAALLEGKDLYAFDSDGSFKKISSSADGFSFSSDGKKMAFWGNNELWVLYLDKKNDQPIQKKGDLVFLTRFSEGISDVFWLNNSYLVFNENSKIKVAETDDRDKVNIAEFGSLSQISKLFWNNSDKKIYLLDKNTLYNSNRLIPWY